jgi:hypothetical protein
MIIIIRSSKQLGKPKALWSAAYIQKKTDVLKMKISIAEERLASLYRELKALDQTP